MAQMALTTCPDCRGTVSDIAVACPHCGRPMGVEAPDSLPPVLTPAPVVPDDHHAPVAVDASGWWHRWWPWNVWGAIGIIAIVMLIIGRVSRGGGVIIWYVRDNTPSLCL